MIVEYDEDEYEEILDRFSDGEHRYQIFNDGENGVSIPVQVFNRRLREDPSFYERYLKSIEFATEAIAQNCVYIADNSEDVQKAKLQLDARKFIITRSDTQKQYRLENKDRQSNVSNDLFNIDYMNEEEHDLFVELIRKRIQSEKVRKEGI